MHNELHLHDFTDIVTGVRELKLYFSRVLAGINNFLKTLQPRAVLTFKTRAP